MIPIYDLPASVGPRGIIFYFSIIVFFLILCGGLYLLWQWRARKHRFHLLWGIGLWGLYAFQIPFLLSNLGAHFVITNFYAFYAIAAPLSFVGMYLIYAGATRVAPFKEQKKVDRYLIFWFLSSVAVFANTYGTGGGYFENHLVQVLPAILFYLPLQALIVMALGRLLAKPEWRKDPWLVAGLVCEIVAMASSFFLTGFAVRQILIYPPNFWFVSVATYSPIYMFEAAGLLLLLLGTMIINRRHYHITKESTPGAVSGTDILEGAV